MWHLTSSHCSENVCIYHFTLPGNYLYRVAKRSIQFSLTNNTMILFAVVYLDRFRIYIQTGRFLLIYRVWIAKFFSGSAPDPLLPPPYPPLLHTPIRTCNSSAAPTLKNMLRRPCIFQPKSYGKCSLGFIDLLKWYCLYT